MFKWNLSNAAPANVYSPVVTSGGVAGRAVKSVDDGVNFYEGRQKGNYLIIARGN